MTLELDMVVDTNPADAPFGKAIGLRRQRFEVGPVELFEQRPAGDAEPTDQRFVVELPQQLTDRGIEFGQTVEATVSQAAEQPSLAPRLRPSPSRAAGAAVPVGSRYHNGPPSRRRSD